MTTTLRSQIDTVTLYHQGATVTRRLRVEADDSGALPTSIALPELPLALTDSSVRLRVTSAPEGANLVVSDLRVGLWAPLAETPPEDPDLERLRGLERDREKLEARIRHLTLERRRLGALATPERPEPSAERPPPPSPVAARVALERFVHEADTSRRQTIRALKRELRELKREIAQLRDAIARASSARRVQPAQLTKQVVATLHVEGDGGAAAWAELELDYDVPGARWAPSYQCDISADGATALLTLRALVCQRSGEDWSTARLRLSTASPTRWTELPRLTSIRIGKRQPPPPAQKGFRPPPRGAAALYQDYDRAREAAERQLPPWTSWQPPELSVSTAPVLLPDRPPQPPRQTQTISTRRSAENQATQRVTDDERVALLSKQFGVPSVRLDEFHIEPSVLNLVPEEVARKHLVVPLNQIQTSLVVAMSDPANVYAIDELKFITGFNIEVVVTSEDAIRRALAMYGAEDFAKEELLYDDMMVGGAVAEEDEEDTLEAALFAADAPAEAPMPAPAPKMAKAARRSSRKKRDKGVRPSKPPQASREPALPDFGALRLAFSGERRGRLVAVEQRARYMEHFEQGDRAFGFDPISAAQAARRQAEAVASLPAGARDVREEAGRFDYLYEAEDRVDVPSDGSYHAVPVTRREGRCRLEYVVVPREDTDVYRIAFIENPDRAPMLPGPVEVYIGGDYALTTQLPTVAPMERFRLGLGVEQAIKCARNTSYHEQRSASAVVATADLHHRIAIELVNNLPRPITCEVRERIPQPAAEAEVVVTEGHVEPAWEAWEQQNDVGARQAPLLKGGRRWTIALEATARAELVAEYVVQIYANNELKGGNRRES